MELVYSSMSLTEDFLESYMVYLFGVTMVSNIFSALVWLYSCWNPNFSLEYTHSQELNFILVHM